jgi:hypothetical protein
MESEHNGKPSLDENDKRQAHVENAEQMIEDEEHKGHIVPGYGMERGKEEANTVVAEDNPWVHQNVGTTSLRYSKARLTVA